MLSEACILSRNTYGYEFLGMSSNWIRRRRRTIRTLPCGPISHLVSNNLEIEEEFDLQKQVCIWGVELEAHRSVSGVP